MLMMVAALMLLVWFVGLATAYTFGGFIDVLLIAALVMILLEVLHDRRPALD